MPWPQPSRLASQPDRPAHPLFLSSLRAGCGQSSVTLLAAPVCRSRRAQHVLRRSRNSQGFRRNAPTFAEICGTSFDTPSRRNFVDDPLLVAKTARLLRDMLLNLRLVHSRRFSSRPLGKLVVACGRLSFFSRLAERCAHMCGRAQAYGPCDLRASDLRR